MGENLKTGDGTVLTEVPPVSDEEAQRQFAQAMAAPEPDEPQVAAPPPKDQEAPYGRTKDGKPKKGPGGRPPKDADKPRTQARAMGAARDYTEDLHGVVQLGWGVLAATSPADAAALKLHGPGLVGAWNNLAQHDARVARGIAWLTSGGPYGAVVMATAPLIMQVMSNHGQLPHGRLVALGLHDPAELAEITAADLEAMHGHQEAAPAAA